MLGVGISGGKGSAAAAGAAGSGGRSGGTVKAIRGPYGSPGATMRRNGVFVRSTGPGIVASR